MGLLGGVFHYKTLTSNKLFHSVHKIVNVKTQLHRLHIFGNIFGCTHNFCNAKDREKKDMSTCIAHNFFYFGMFFLLKGIKLLVWETKNINMGGTNPTNFNYSTIGNVKIIDTMKYDLTWQIKQYQFFFKNMVKIKSKSEN